MSKQIVEGKIDRVYTKDFGEADRYGNQYAVNINIDGQWYGLGKKKKPVANVRVGEKWHQLAEGDVIEAVAESVERNGRTYVNIKTSDITVKEVANGGGANGPTNSGSTVSVSGSGGYQMSNDERQKAIMRQSAMGYAAQVVAATLTSKSSLDQAAEDVVAMADQFFLPYAEYGLTASEMRQKDQEEQEQQGMEEEFNDSIPF